MRILELLEQTRRAHDGEDIYRQLLDHGDEIGLATVYAC
jgi:Fur family ferric uptake transcriptional regulator